MVKALHCVIPTIGNCYLRKAQQAMFPPLVSWSITIWVILNPLAFTSSKIVRSISPSASPDVPCQFAPLPLLVLCANQQILSRAVPIEEN